MTENHSLVRLMPSLTSICSKSGTWRMNSACCLAVQNPITRSTPGAVVPGPVEQHDLARGRQMVDVALEVPLGALALGGLLQRDDARPARVEVLHEPLDGAALACRVTALEHDDVPCPLAWLHFCSFSNSICSRRFCSSYSSRFMRSSYG